MQTLTPQIRNALIAALLAGNVEMAYAIAPEYWKKVRYYFSVAATIDKLIGSGGSNWSMALRMIDYIDQLVK